MNKIQKTIAFVSAVLILFISLVAINEKSYLAGIVGIALTAGLLIYCFTGKKKTEAKKLYFSHILKSKAHKIFLVIMGGIIISLSVFLLYSYISYKRQQKIEEREYAEQIKAEKLDEQIRNEKLAEQIKEDNLYIKNIEIVTKNFKDGQYAGEGYLFIAIKNNGNRTINALNIEVSYYEKQDYLVKREVVSIPRNEYIHPGKTQKYKLRLSYPSPWWRAEKYIHSIEIVSCRTVYSQ